MATRRSSDSRRTTHEASTPATAGGARTGETSAPAERAARRRSSATSAAAGAKARAPVAVSAERRRAMIAEAAYLRAERRGFAPGRDVEDWLAAEQEVDRLLSGGAGARQ